METIIKKIKRLGLKLAVKKAIGYEAVFNIAYRKMNVGLIEKDFSDEFIGFPYSKYFWYADPLIFTYNDITYVFMEVFDRKNKKGAIGYSIITADGVSTPQIVIEEPYHMSFPFVFEFDGTIYMIPETEANQSINLYRSVNFPDVWVLDQSIKTDLRIVDSVLFSTNGNELKFLASTFDNKDVKKSKFLTYCLKQNNNGFFSFETKMVNANFDYWYRNAGQIIRQNNDTFLVVQRSTPAVYGYSVIFIKIKSGSNITIDYNDMSEINPNDVRVKGKKKILGVHTYSRNEQYEIIDYEYLDRKK